MANLTWEFHLTELKFHYLLLLFDRTDFAVAWPLGEVGQIGFRNQFRIHWNPNTLITLMIFNATNGTFSCNLPSCLF